MKNGWGTTWEGLDPLLCPLPMMLVGLAGAPLELGRLISYRGETDCGKRPRYFQPEQMQL